VKKITILKIIHKSFKTFLSAFLAKQIVSLLLSKFSIKKGVVKNFRNNFKFALASMLISSIFLSYTFVLQKVKKLIA